jgi:hypothetical protein
MTYEEVPDFPGLTVRLGPDGNGRRIVTGVRLEADAVTAEMLRKIPFAHIEREANGWADAELPPLRRSPDMAPDAFSALVAAHFKAWARVVPNPGAAMAKASGANPQTVHTWIREARLRGLLPPARRRKG